MKKLLLSTGIALFTHAGFSQTVTGKITGAEGKPLAGALVSSSGKHTLTDSTGFFLLNVSGKVEMHVSYTGYRIKDTLIEPKSNAVLHISLEPEQDNLDEVVIVASSRTNSRIEDLPTKVEVLGAEEVQEENGIKPGNIASLLGDIAGIQIQQTNAATGNADMRIQGLQGKYTQILRDGIPLFGGYSGSFSILQIPPLDLQQIELVKGPASTLYGGGAIAGMVNLVSKKPKLDKPERSFTINRSTLKENNLNLFFSGRDQKTGYTLFTGGTLQDPVDVNKDGFSDVPSVKSVFVHPRVFLYGGAKSTVILGYAMNYEDRDGGDMDVLNNHSSAQHQFFIRNKSYRNTGDIAWEQKFSNDAQLTVKGSGSFFNRQVSTNVFGMKANQFAWYTEAAYTKHSGQHNWVIGINFNGDRLAKQQPDSSLVPNEKNSTLGFFAQDDWKFNDQLTLQTGLRIDAHNTYGAFVLPRLSLMYKAGKRITMRIGGGLGYKTPTLFNSELDERDYHYLTGYSAHVQPERSVGANCDINYKNKLGSWQLTVNQSFFYNRVQHPLLLTGTAPLLYYTNTNGHVRTMGFETYVQATQDELELYLGYVFTNAKRSYDPSHPNLPLIAKHKLATVIAYAFSEKVRVGIESSYTGRQFLENGTATQPYLFTALMLRYSPGKCAFVLNCENLFDYRQNKNNTVVFPPYTNPSFPEIWAPLDGRVVNLSMYVRF